MGKNFILNADDFGRSKANNRAVLEGYNNGFLTSASLCANGKAFNAAVNEILPECPDLGIGVHLNIVDGKALTESDMLTDKKGRFNNGFLSILLKSNSQRFLYQVEQEFRAQIELVQRYHEIDHITSHNHIHAIPSIFNITVKLAEEYNIPYVRTHYEEFYVIPSIKRHLSFRYPLNIIKLIVLNAFSKKNKKLSAQSTIKTNDYIIGIGYEGMMDSDAVSCGIEDFEEDCTVETPIHPCCYIKNKSDRHYKEFKITQDKALEYKIKISGFEITNYKKAG